MFIAMNRFKVAKDRAGEFEQMWKSRESYLHETPGFVEFNLLRGPDRGDHRVYSSHTVWASVQAFEDWTRSEAFRKAHANAGKMTDGITLGSPEFEGFEAIEGFRVSKDAD